MRGNEGREVGRSRGGGGGGGGAGDRGTDSGHVIRCRRQTKLRHRNCLCRAHPIALEIGDGSSYLRCALSFSLSSLCAGGNDIRDSATVGLRVRTPLSTIWTREYGVLRRIRSSVAHNRVAEIPAGTCDMDPAGKTR